MKTRIFLMLLMAAALLVSCQKEKNEPVAGEQEVSFSATLVQPDLKNSEDFLPCKTEVATHAHIVLFDDSFFDVQVYTIGTKLYTQAIKLAPGNYVIKEFFLYNNANGIPGYQNTAPADVVVYATPAQGSTYEVYLNPLHKLNYEFTVTAFQKIEIDIEVLCFVDLVYQNFGFFWFDITQIIIREQCFFGDFCIKHIEEYTGSSYWLQPGHPLTGFYDAPAIIQLWVKQKLGAGWVDVYGSPFTNNLPTNYGVGAPVCIEYPDVVNQVDSFSVELKILVLVGSTPQFVSFNVWKFKDDQMILAGTDKVVDFVLGTCNLLPADLVLPPYQNLPETATVLFQHPDPVGPGYWGVTVSNPFPAGTGYDIPIGPTLPGWCGDNNVYLSPGSWNVNFYGSLTSVGWPAGMPFSLGKIKMVNWLFNNITSFTGFSNGIVTDAQGLIVQDACWEILVPEGEFNATGMALTMANTAEAHSDYMPLPGGWAAAIIVVNDEPQKYQLIFTVVDP